MPKVKKRCGDTDQASQFVFLAHLQSKLIQIAGGLENGCMSQGEASKELVDLVMEINEQIPIIDAKA